MKEMRLENQLKTPVFHQKIGMLNKIFEIKLNQISVYKIFNVQFSVRILSHSVSHVSRSVSQSVCTQWDCLSVICGVNIWVSGFVWTIQNNSKPFYIPFRPVCNPLARIPNPLASLLSEPPFSNPPIPTALKCPPPITNQRAILSRSSMQESAQKSLVKGMQLRNPAWITRSCFR